MQCYLLKELLLFQTVILFVLLIESEIILLCMSGDCIFFHDLYSFVKVHSEAYLLTSFMDII